MLLVKVSSLNGDILNRRYFPAKPGGETAFIYIDVIKYITVYHGKHSTHVGGLPDRCTVKKVQIVRSVSSSYIQPR